MGSQRVGNNWPTFTFLNGLVVFPAFFNLSLNFAIQSPWFEPQSALGQFWWLYLLNLWLERRSKKCPVDINWIQLMQCVILSLCFLINFLFEWSVHWCEWDVKVSFYYCVTVISLFMSVSVCLVNWGTPMVAENIFTVLSYSWIDLLVIM